jgi:hypothetical protein
MILTVTPQHIASADAEHLLCPVERALADAGIAARAGYFHCYSNSEEPLYKFSVRLSREISRWDSGKGFKPGRYRLLRPPK